jgi:diadenosine tetraphosphate (Ap4A) HIT family hydrolase
MSYQDHELCAGADFCQEISGTRDVTFHRIYAGHPASRRIITTDRFVLMADLSPMTVGHLLLLPKAHYFSFAQVTRQQLNALGDVLDLILPRYAQTFGAPPVIMEHGSSRNDDHIACITHAHWHMVPLNGDQIADRIRLDGLPETTLSDIRTLGQEPWTETSYYLTSYDGTLHLYRPQPTLRRQYVRSVIGRCLGMRDPEWDYAVIVRRHLLRETLAMTASWANQQPSRTGHHQ